MSDPSKVFVPLSQEELKKKSEELASVILSLDELAEEKKEVTRDLADRKLALSRQARELSTAIRQKGEWRDSQASLFSLPKTERGDA